MLWPRDLAAGRIVPECARLSIGAIFLTLLCGVAATILWSGAPETVRATLSSAIATRGFSWLSVGNIDVRATMMIDGLTIAMFLTIAIVAMAVQAFSVGYMRNEPRLVAFFAYISLFCFAMLGLVLSGNLLVTFVFWDLVGICS